MRIKPGVSMKGMSPQAALGMQIVESIYRKYNAGELRITSITEGKHKRKSLHITGYAFDTGLPTSKSMIPSIVNDGRECLGEEWDVVDESTKADGPHLHWEWDPKY